MGVVAITVKLVLQKWGLRQFRLFSTQGTSWTWRTIGLAYVRRFRRRKNSEASSRAFSRGG